MSDYMFDKDRIFAYINLDENELHLYEKIYSYSRYRCPSRTLLCTCRQIQYVLMRRVKQKGGILRKPLLMITLIKLTGHINQYFLNYNDSPLLIINTNEIDFVHNFGDLQDLINTIKEMKTGTKYYIPVP